MPEGLVNYLALVGWSPESNEEIFDMEGLIKEFSFERVSKTGGIFDKDKLDWVNAHHIREYDLDKLTRLAIPYLIEAGYIDEKFAKEYFDWLKIMVDTVREGISTVSEVVDKVDIFFKDQIQLEGDEALEVLKQEQVPLLLEAIKEELASIEEIDEEYAKGFMKNIQKKNGNKR